MFRWQIALGLVLLGLPATAWAQWPALGDVPTVDPTGARDVAIIVAVEDYLLLPDVPGAVANANDWEVFFRDGLRVPNVHVLANQDATREGMQKFAKTAAADVRDGGTVWWVFIGHGAPAVDGKDGLLVGMDAQQAVESLTARGLPQRELLGLLQTPRSRTVMVIDACFSGRAQNGEALAAGVQPVVAVDPGASLAANSVVLSAAKATEVAGQLDGAQRPAFSYLMLGALRGWADANDGEVTAAEALHFVRRQLRGVKGRQQTPQIIGDVTLVLSRGVTEEGPRVVADGVESAATAVQEKSPPVAGESGTASATLEYMRRKIIFEKKKPRQGGRLLSGIAFYEAIDRPDLAQKWMSHKPVMWLTGLAITALGGVSVGFGASAAMNDSLSDGQQEAYFLLGSLVGSFSILGGATTMVLGFVGDHEPLNYVDRRIEASKHNAKLRQELGLDDGVDWQTSRGTRRTTPALTLASVNGDPVVGFTFRF